MLRASVIVPARDAAGTITRTLEALARQELDGEYEVIVIDDGSSDATGALARRAPGPVTVLEQPPSGPAAARNFGAEHAAGPVLAFCDADVFPAPGWLAAGLAAFTDADLVQGQVRPDPDAIVGPFDRSLWITHEVGLWEAANLFVTRKLFDRVGGFEDWLAPPGEKTLAEDCWFGYRAIRLGARHAFCEHALAYHAVFPRSWVGYVSERRRLRHFPAIAAKMPELRTAFLYRRVFLTARSAEFDLGLAGMTVAAIRRSPVPLIAAAPYVRTLLRHAQRARPAGPRAAIVAVADAAADIVGLGAMAAGSARRRAVVL